MRFEPLTSFFDVHCRRRRRRRCRRCLRSFSMWDYSDISFRLLGRMKDVSAVGVTTFSRKAIFRKSRVSEAAEAFSAKRLRSSPRCKNLRSIIAF